MLVDSHCHLDRLDLDSHNGKLHAALEYARSQGVTHFLCVCIDLEHFSDIVDIANQYQDITLSVGVHPSSKEGKDPDVDELVQLANQQNVVAIGETGLDYFYDKGDLSWQRDRFRHHIQAARLVNKPLIIHTRDAPTDTLQILKDQQASDVGGVMHCFVEDWETAKASMDMNFYISFSGIVTFKNANELKQVAKKMPTDRILIETDSPYLAPVPFRGKANQPAYVKQVAECIAELRNETVEQVAEYTTRNYFKLFS